MSLFEGGENMNYFGCVTKQDYMDLALKCDDGIKRFKEKLIGFKSKKERDKYIQSKAKVIEELEHMYRVSRSAYDVLYFTYEYFSEDKNPDNDNNLIPAGCTMEDAPLIHYELCDLLNEIAWENHGGKACSSMPRGFAKSTFASNSFPIHQCYFDCGTEGGRKYILDISETEDLSTKFVDYINSQLKYNKK